MESETSSLGQRLKRYGNVSLGGASLLPTFLLKSLGVKVDPYQHADDITAVLGNLKGPLMKIAQILGTVPGILPEEYSEKLRKLQAEAPSMGWPFVKRRMATELGSSWQDHFKHFEKTARFAASLGQVHHAVDQKGRALALKLQYPDMKGIIEADLLQFKGLLSLYNKFSKGLETGEIYEEIKKHLLEELDYEKEAFHMEVFRAVLKDFKAIRIPTVVPEFTTKRLLTLSWEEGRPLLEFKDAPQTLKNTVAQNLFEAWYVPFYRAGLLHGDPHPGNYRGQEDGTLTLFDFGCVRVFRPKFIQGVIDLYRSLLTNDEALMVFAYESWGFKNLQKPVITALTLWARFLYGPLLYDRVMSLQENSTPEAGKAIAATVHKALREAGGISPPREFVFMDRAAVGLGSVFIRLEAKLNWHRVFENVIEGFDVQYVEKQQNKYLNPKI
ncbi:MAG: ABC transporter ATP-binding protein [Alphaproteobacteria bacterium 16-39-46]|nr:MAG: ABC transporter ATP-binding protein [Alphaproteobacteria bacterium 16-39-46]OZA43016.1 MAG: ABC transporter ATP-binding protein [Alphaproteobacteria bacterium 17-39-52]HQS84140.1 AarF/ABC1/UbiB kinase family protein [Alphaproteobacteria bacterium]HQS93996.1 AarF/ABC1/UbiB kinase family protein [Alphaproteobacteria bacterium]